jgi:hypothetical protein
MITTRSASSNRASRFRCRSHLAADLELPEDAFQKWDQAAEFKEIKVFMEVYLSL